MKSQVIAVLFITFIIFTIFILSIGINLTGRAITPGEETGVTRDLPGSISVGQRFQVTLFMNINESARPNAIGIEETIPSGWTLYANSSPQYDVYDSDTGDVYWLFWNDTVNYTEITYSVTPTSGSGTFQGIWMVVEGDEVTERVIGGDTHVSAPAGGDRNGDRDGGGGNGGGSPWGGPSGCVEGQNQTCGNNTGRCKTGIQTCHNGVWSECTGGVASIPEICNEIDDDCDDAVDDGITCECLIGETKGCGLETGICEAGYRLCIAGSWSAECINETGPTEEICRNGIDDDCDGDTDEDECIMGAESACPEGEITQACLCEGRTYTEGYCYNDYYFREDPKPTFPWEVVSVLGGFLLALVITILGVREVKKFRSIHKQVSSEEQQKVKIKPAKGEMTKVGDIIARPGDFVDKKIKIYGHVKISSYVSAKEFWYSFYDDTGVIALHLNKKLDLEYVEMEVKVKKSKMGHIHLEAKL